MTSGAWIDRLTMPLFPKFTLRRQRARLAAEMLVRAYDAAASGRRTSGWRRSSGDANAEIGSGSARTRDVIRDLARNNAYLASALNTIADHVIGWGIAAHVEGDEPAWWRQWTESTACDADGRSDFAGLQKQAMRAAAQDGEVLIRRRWRARRDLEELGLPIPLQLQVLEADYLDTSKDEATPNGGQIIQGVEFDPIGHRVAYWLFTDHPGASGAAATFGRSRRIPASEILHIYRVDRPGQVRGMSLFAPIVLPLKDLDDYEDAALMKQKVAACLAIIMTDPDGTMPPAGTVDPENPMIDQLGPGAIISATPGRQVSVVQPPSVAEHAEFTSSILRKIASGIGVTYEDLTGHYEGLPFSAARMSRLRHWARVEDWQYRVIIPQLCQPAGAWANEAAALMSLPPLRSVEWTPQPAKMIEPDKEGLAYTRLVRSGLMSLSRALRELGYNPRTVLAEMAKDNQLLDSLKLILDSDPRKTTQQGGPRDKPPTGAARPTAEPSPNGNGARHHHPEDAPASAVKLRLVELELADVRKQLDRALDTLAVRPDAKAPELHVTIPPAPGVTFAEGAIRNDIHPANVTVDAPVTIAEGAVRVEAPVTVQQASPPPTVTVVRAPARPAIEPGSAIAATDAE